MRVGMLVFCICDWLSPHDENENDLDTFGFVMIVLVVVTDG